LKKYELFRADIDIVPIPRTPSNCNTPYIYLLMTIPPFFKMSLPQKWQPAFSFDDDDDMDQIYEEIFERCKNGTASPADWRDLPVDYKAQLERLRTTESCSDSYSDEEDTDATEYEYTEKDWEVQRLCTPGPGFDDDDERDPHTVAIFDSDDLQPIEAPTNRTASLTFNTMPNPLSIYAVPVLPYSDQHKPDLDTGCYCADCAVTTVCERARHPARNQDQQPTRDFQDYKQEFGDEFGHGRSMLRGEIVVEKGLDGNEFVRVVHKDKIVSPTPESSPSPLHHPTNSTPQNPPSATTTHDYTHARRTSTPLLRPLAPSIYINRHGPSFMKIGNVWRDIWAQCPLCEMPLAYVPDLERARHLTVCHGEIREQNVAWARRKTATSGMIGLEVVGAKTPYLTRTIGLTASLKSAGTDQRTLASLLNAAQPKPKPSPAVTIELGRVRQVTPAVKKLVFTVAPEPEMEIEEHPHRQDDDGGCMSPVPVRKGTKFCKKEDIKFGFLDDVSPSENASGSGAEEEFEDEEDIEDDELNTSDSDQPSSASSVDGGEVDIPKDAKMAIPATEKTEISTGVCFNMPMQWTSPVSIATLRASPLKPTTGFLSGYWMGLGSPLSVLKRRVWDMLD
jgi:hypothetical protein